MERGSQNLEIFSYTFGLKKNKIIYLPLLSGDLPAAGRGISG
jgi:hypothetical protein